MDQPLDFHGLQDLYGELIAGRRAWLDYHLSPLGPTPFGARLLLALHACERREPGLGRRLIEELAQVRYVPAAQGEDGWKSGFEQLIQKLAEILVCRLLCAVQWPEGSRIECEPRNRRTGKRPEFAVFTPGRTWLFEVKCPTFIKHNGQRHSNPAQLPVRSPFRDMPMFDETAVTLPRDNVLKDFLESAEAKFADFGDEPRTSILVVVWDSFMYEAISVLAHEQTGLLTENSWLKRDDARVPFASVDGVIVVNRQAELVKSAREKFDCSVADPFMLGAEGDLPSVWCPNLGVGELDPAIARAFDAYPVGDAAIASDYAKTDFVLWLEPARRSDPHVKVTGTQAFDRSSSSAVDPDPDS
jgi:hypothetical protein